MNIFFTGSIRGGRALQPQYALIVDALKKHGIVHSQSTHNDALSQYGETCLFDTEIFEREREALQRSDIVVAEVTTPSLGVGSLIAYATQFEKKIIALYHGEDTLKLSAMIKGDPHVDVYLYKTKKEVLEILDTIFQKFCCVSK